MSTTIENKIIVINDEGDALDVSQTTVLYVTVNQILLPPISINSSSNTVSITRKTINPIIITAPV
jgi:hypothetical protein